jgi:hypothetical protein
MELFLVDGTHSTPSFQSVAQGRLFTISILWN